MSKSLPSPNGQSHTQFSIICFHSWPIQVCHSRTGHLLFHRRPRTDQLRHRSFSHPHTVIVCLPSFLPLPSRRRRIITLPVTVTVVSYCHSSCVGREVVVGGQVQGEEGEGGRWEAHCPSSCPSLSNCAGGVVEGGREGHSSSWQALHHRHCPLPSQYNKYKFQSVPIVSWQR